METIVNFVVGAEWLWIVIIGVIIGIPVAIIVRKKKKKVEIGVEDLGSDSEEVQDHNKKALTILKERLAKGEISKEEYEKLKKEFQS